MNSNLKKESNIEQLDNATEDDRKKRKCLAICLIILIIMMLPSTLAFLAIF